MTDQTSYRTPFSHEYPCLVHIHCSSTARVIEVTAVQFNSKQKKEPSPSSWERWSSEAFAWSS